jgi:dihydropteroate synthase
VNVTPDSFSDGGRFLDPDEAFEHGLRLMAAGADLVDVGGESARPGADEVPSAEELGRVVPVIRRLVAAGVPVSVDTTKPEVASEAVGCGAEVINDITGLSNPEMVRLAAGSGVGVVIMHMQGNPRIMQLDPHYEDVVSEVRDYLVGRALSAEAAGVDHEAIVIDPGIGFGKNLKHNLSLLADLRTLAVTGYPVMIGTSRKSFLGTLTGVGEAASRDLATAVSVALAVERGIAVVRVHNVAVCREAVTLTEAIVGEQRG